MSKPGIPIGPPPGGADLSDVSQKNKLHMADLVPIALGCYPPEIAEVIGAAADVELVPAPDSGTFRLVLAAQAYGQSAAANPSLYRRSKGLDRDLAVPDYIQGIATEYPSAILRCAIMLRPGESIRMIDNAAAGNISGQARYVDVLP